MTTHLDRALRRSVHAVALLALVAPSLRAAPQDGPGLGQSLHRNSSFVSDGERAGIASWDVPFHYQDTLKCSQCHVMHASMQHNYQGGTGPEDGIPSFPHQFIPAAYLLKKPDPLDLCLTCHDNTVGIPDVVGADVNGLTMRSAGFFDEPEIINPRGHDLGRDLPPAPGEYCMRCHFGSNEKVTCIDCHNPHGNGNPRNLQWASYPEGTPPLGLLNPLGLGGLLKYERENVSYGTLDSDLLREVTNICLDCHHVFTGSAYNDPNGDGIHERHPSYDSERGDPNNIAQGGAPDFTTDPDHWLDGTGSGFQTTPRVPFVVPGAADYSSALVVDPALNGVFCISCHQVHGNFNSFGLMWDYSVLDPRTYGCEQCHNKAPIN